MAPLHPAGQHDPHVEDAQQTLDGGQKESAMTADEKVMVGVPGFEPGASCWNAISESVEHPLILHPEIWAWPDGSRPHKVMGL